MSDLNAFGPPQVWYGPGADYGRPANVGARADAFGAAFGAEAAAPAGSGGSSGGVGVGISINPAEIISAITMAVQIGRDEETDPQTMAADEATNIQQFSGAIKRIQREISTELDKRDRYLQWLKDPDRPIWAGGNATTQAWRAKGKYTSGLYKGIWKDYRVYKNSARALQYWNSVKPGGHIAKGIARMQSTRDRGTWDGASTGNIDNYRQWLRTSWSIMLGLEPYQPLMAVLGKPLTRSTLLLDLDTMKIVWGDTPAALTDIAAGRVPFAARELVFETLMTLYNMGVLGPDFRPPTWTFGLSLAEREAVPVGPRMADLIAVLTGQAQLQTQTAGIAYGATRSGTVFDDDTAEGGVFNDATFGATSTTTTPTAAVGLSDRIRAGVARQDPALYPPASTMAVTTTTPPPSTTTPQPGASLTPEERRAKLRAEMKAAKEKYKATVAATTVRTAVTPEGDVVLTDQVVGTARRWGPVLQVGAAVATIAVAAYTFTRRRQAAPR